MPTRRLNYTGRKRILESDATIVLHAPADQVPSFNATLDLQSYGFASGASVCVEAYRQTSWMRFSFGTIAEIKIPEDRRLVEFDSADAVLFRVRVTSGDGTGGMLLGEADRIRPRDSDDEDEPKLSLLPVRAANLGEQTWKLQLDPDPTLLINKRLGDWRDIVRQPAFISLVCPAILREILISVLHIHGHFEIEEDADWKSQWLALAVSLPGVSDIPSEDEDDRIDDWISEVVDSFCRRHRFLDRYMESFTIEESQ